MIRFLHFLFLNLNDTEFYTTSKLFYQYFILSQQRIFYNFQKYLTVQNTFVAETRNRSALQEIAFIKRLALTSLVT